MKDEQMLLLLAAVGGGLLYIGLKLKAGTKRLAAGEELLKKGEDATGVKIDDLVVVLGGGS